MSSNTTAPVLPVIPPQDHTLGALSVGTFLSLILYGLALHQSYQYYHNYPHDKFWLRSYVMLVLAFETFCSVLATYACYFYIVQNYFFPQTLQIISWSLSTLSIASSITVALAQLFFVQRIFFISKKWWAAAIIVLLLVFLELGISFVAAAKGFQLKTWALYQDWTYLTSIFNGASTLADFLISGVLILALRESRANSIRSSSDTKLGTIILYTISTGLVTGLFHLVTFVISLTRTHDLIYLGVGIMAARFYCNWLLAALNSRRMITDRQSGDSMATDTSPFGVSVRTMNETKTFQSARFHNPRSATSMTATAPDVVDIKITTELTRDTSEMFQPKGRSMGY